MYSGKGGFDVLKREICTVTCCTLLQYHHTNDDWGDNSDRICTGRPRLHYGLSNLHISVLVVVYCTVPRNESDLKSYPIGPDPHLIGCATHRH
jgi:hypothetical protein